jgi:hypothetical protein
LSLVLLVFCTWKRGAKIYILVIVTRKNVGIETEKREIDEGILNVKIACSRCEGEKKKKRVRENMKRSPIWSSSQNTIIVRNVVAFCQYGSVSTVMMN